MQVSVVVLFFQLSFVFLLFKFISIHIIITFFNFHYYCFYYTHIPKNNGKIKINYDKKNFLQHIQTNTQTIILAK